MKRSEVLKIIDDQYSKYVDDLVRLDMDDDKSMKSFVKLNERVLSALEKAGILPLPIEKSAQVELEEGDELFIPTRRWEDEK
jgi:hypothetical protein